MVTNDDVPMNPEYMDYAEHERTYRGFIFFTKWGSSWWRASSSCWPISSFDVTRRGLARCRGPRLVSRLSAHQAGPGALPE